MNNPTPSEDLRTLLLSGNTAGLRYQIEQALLQESLSGVIVQLGRIEKSHFGRREGLFRRIVFESLNIMDFHGIDQGPLELIGEMAQTTESRLDDAARCAALELLRRQVRRGNTYFLDIDVLGDTCAAVLVPQIVAVRRAEIGQEMEGGPVNPEDLASTYYGHLYLSSYVRPKNGSGTALTDFLKEAGIPIPSFQTVRDVPLDSQRVRFTNASGRSARLLRLILDLADWNSSRRLEAAAQLGVICDSRAEAFLCVATRDQYQWVREAAVKALGEIGQSQSVVALVHSLWDLDSSVRKRARESLEQIGSPAVLGLIHTLEEHDAISDQEAARLLASSHPRMLDSMAAAIEQVSAEARSLAAEALGCIGDVRAVPSLERAAKSNDVRLRDAALTALQKTRERTQAS